MKKIVLTGGGTAGHVTPNIALLPALQAEGYEVSYMGSYDGIEKKLIADFDIPYYGISTGKFRRYLDLKNFTISFLQKFCSQKYMGSNPDSKIHDLCDIREVYIQSLRLLPRSTGPQYCWEFSTNVDSSSSILRLTQTVSLFLLEATEFYLFIILRFVECL